jgi:hypothetical protein
MVGFCLSESRIKRLHGFLFFVVGVGSSAVMGGGVPQSAGRFFLFSR